MNPRRSASGINVPVNQSTGSTSTLKGEMMTVRRQSSGDEPRPSETVETPPSMAGLREPWGPISRILYPDASRDGGHPSSPGVATGVQRPTRGPGRAPVPHRSGACPSIRPCSRRGLPASRVATGPGALLPHRFTLACAPARRGHRRSGLCGTCRRLTTPGRYPAPHPVESGLSSPHEAQRPPGPHGSSPIIRVRRSIRLLAAQHDVHLAIGGGDAGH